MYHPILGTISKKKMNNLVYNCVNDILGQSLCYAFALVKRNGLIFRIMFENGKQIISGESEDINHSRINLSVVDGYVESCTIG